MCTLLAGKPPIKIGGEWRPIGKGPHDDVEVRVAYSLLHLPTLLSQLDDVALTEMRLTVRKQSILVMLKGVRKGRPLVAWFAQETWRDALTLVATCADSGHADWRVDKPPPWLEPTS